MNVLLACVVAIVATTGAVSAMLLVRRRAPQGGWFTSGDRASGVFGVLASGFAILLGFVVFLAFTSYDVSRTGAESEARTVAQQVETAQFFAPPARDELTGALVCYARYVAGPEWDRLADGTLGDTVSPWSAAMFRILTTVEPESASEQTAYDQWFDQTIQRQQARQDRVHGSVGVIPTPMWIGLFTLAAVIFVFLLFFADGEEGAVPQAVLMGSVVMVIVVLLLLLRFLDNPYRPGIGALRPVAMERTLRLLDQSLPIAGFEGPLPCDAAGRAR